MIRWLTGTWMWWVDLFSTREAPTSLAIVRVALCVVLLWDLVVVGLYGLPPMLWSPRDAGGITDVYGMKHVPESYAWLAPEAGTIWGPTIAWTLWATTVTFAVTFGAGVLTRFSGLALLLVYAQTAMLNNTADRGIDRMIRVVVLLLILSGSGRTFSFDAWVRTGSWLGDGRPIAAWPRYLLIGQLILMYWCAGAEKFALSWFPWGGYTALYVILQDPIFANTDFGFLGSPWLFWTTQLGTAVSHMWEWTIPVLLLAYWYRSTRERPGRVRATFNALDVRMIYVVIGVVFHLALAGTLRLGIFPAAMLALYPAFFHPDELLGAFRRLRRTRTRAPEPEVAVG